MAAPAGGGGSSQGGEGGRPRQPQATRGGRGERECHRRCERFPVGRPHITNPTPSPSTLAARRPCCPALPAVADRVWRRRRASPQNGVTALMCAATSGKLDCLEHLTAKGANLEAVTSKVSAALCEPPPAPSAPRPPPTPPAAPAAPPSPPPLTACGAAAAPPQNGETALMFAAKNGKLDCLEHLVAKGANLNAQDYVRRGPAAACGGEGCGVRE